jgi:hypothetical protein
MRNDCCRRWQGICLPNRRTAERELADWGERDAEILVRTGSDPELAEHAAGAPELRRP